MVRAFRIHSRLEEETLERQRYLSRKLSIYPEGGIYVLAARLTAEDGASLMRAIDEEEHEALYRTERKSGARPARESRAASRAAAARRRADALVRLVERGLAGPTADEASAPVTGTRAGRFQVVLHVEPETLAEEGEPGVSELDGTRVSCETGRRIACDAGLVRLTRDAHGQHPRRRAPDPYHPGRPPARARDPGPRVPVPGLRPPLHRGAPRETLGRRRDDGPKNTVLHIPDGVLFRAIDAGLA